MISSYKYNPKLYFLATFVVTYILWFTGAYLSFSSTYGGIYMLIMLPGLMAPFIISSILIAKSKNKDLKNDFINRLFNLKLINLKTIPVVFLLMPAVILLSIILSIPFGGSISQFQFSGGFSFSTDFVPVLFLLLLAATFEELGWRGYAFDSLQSRYSLFKASIIFGIFWSLWHFPLIFVNNSYQYEIFNQSIWYGLNFFLSILPLGVIITWMCLKNRKSIILAIIFHFLINLNQELLAITQDTKIIETGVLFLVAAAIIFYDKKMFFEKLG